MPATVQELADSGFALSRYSRPELIATQAAALVKVVNRAQVALFQFAARVNPLAFTAQVDVPHTAGFWQRPSNAEALFRIEGRGSATTPATVGEVLVVPYDDRAAFAGSPSVYRLGSRYYSAGNAGDPTAGELLLFFARRPAVLSGFTSSTDPEFPDVFLPIFEFEIAAFNARADGGRDGEIDLMIAERNRQITLFEQWLEHETMNESRRLAEVRRFPTERRAPLDALVQAGQ
jgi:hypothetical protein